MASYIENLRTRRANIATELAALDATKAGGLPTAGGEGLNVDHVGYKDGLYRELRELDKLIAEAEKDIADGGAGAGIYETEVF